MRVERLVVGAVSASVEPPAIGGSGAAVRMRRSRMPRPALPRPKPPTSSSASPAAWPKLASPALNSVDRVLRDLEAVPEHVDEQEDQDADREHRQRHARPGADQLEPTDGEPEIDGEAGEGSQKRGFGKRHQRFRSS